LRGSPLFVGWSLGGVRKGFRETIFNLFGAR